MKETRFEVDRMTYRPKEVADATGLSLWTVRQLVRDGHLKAVKMAKAVLISADSVRELLANGVRKAPKGA